MVTVGTRVEVHGVGTGVVTGSSSVYPEKWGSSTSSDVASFLFFLLFERGTGASAGVSDTENSMSCAYYWASWLWSIDECSNLKWWQGCALLYSVTHTTNLLATPSSTLSVHDRHCVIRIPIVFSTAVFRSASWHWSMTHQRIMALSGMGRYYVGRRKSSAAPGCRHIWTFTISLLRRRFGSVRHLDNVQNSKPKLLTPSWLMA